MNRNCTPAQEISRLTGISARRIEAWTIQRLGPDPSLPVAEQVSHYLELEKLAGPGRSNNSDRVAIRLAARNFVCVRLREALMNKVAADSINTRVIPFDFSTEESTDEAFRQSDTVAKQLANGVDKLPLPIRSVVRTLRRNAYQGAEKINDSGENVFHSGIESMIHLFNGGDVLNSEALATMYGFDPSTFDFRSIDFVSALKLSFEDIEYAYTNAPLESIASMATWLRAHFDFVGEYLGVSDAPEAQLEELATYFAPMMSLVFERFASVYADASIVFDSIGIPQGLIPLSAPNS